METLVVNLTGQTHRERLNGREHLVAPLTMIVPGVLNGSNGPLLYLLAEIAKNVDAWNGVPIVVDHPHDSGGVVSARTPKVLNEQGVGIILNARVNGKLTAEGWFDIENTNRIEPGMIDRLLAGTPGELSTGLALDEEKVSGTFNSVEYSAIARNLRPDHLAVFVDKKGACSIDDGCGVLNEDDGDGDDTNLKSPEDDTTEEELGNKSQTKGKDMATGKAKNEAAKKKVVDEIITNCSCGTWEESDRDVLNAFDDDKLEKITNSVTRSTQNAEIADAVAKGAAAGNTQFTYNAESGEFASNALHDPEEDEERRLAELEKKKNEDKAKNKKGTKNEGKQTMTEEEYLATAPPSIRVAVQNSLDIVERDRQSLIHRITHNQELDQRKRVKETLNKMDLEQLRFQESLLPAEAVYVDAPSYAGAAMPVGAAVENIETPEPMPDATWNFKPEWE